MNNGLYVSTDELRSVAANLLVKKEQVMNIYNTNVKKVMEESKDAIVMSGLDFNEFDNQFKAAFTSLSERLNALSTALTKDILPKYDDLSSSIKRAFNSTFASQMQEILSSLKISTVGIDPNSIREKK